MNLSSQKKCFAIGFGILLLGSGASLLFGFARYASAGAGIHTVFVHQKLTEEERLFIYSVMLQQLLQVSTVLGGLTLFWAGFAVIAGRMWRRISAKSLPNEHTTA